MTNIDKQAVIKYAIDNPLAKYKVISAQFGITEDQLTHILYKAGVRRSGGSQRRMDHDAIVKYALDNPSLMQREVAEQFGTTQTTVSKILRAAGNIGNRSRRVIKRKEGHTDEEHKWEEILAREGLGMGRGQSINGKPIAYGWTIYPGMELKSTTYGLSNECREGASI